MGVDCDREHVGIAGSWVAGCRMAARCERAGGSAWCWRQCVVLATELVTAFALSMVPVVPRPRQRRALGRM